MGGGFTQNIQLPKILTAQAYFPMALIFAMLPCCLLIRDSNSATSCYQLITNIHNDQVLFC